MRAKFWMPALCALTVACSSEPNNDVANNAAVNSNDGKGDSAGDITMCAAIRGNGELISAHYGALARIAEHYGPLHAVSGGSSASITSFLAESMHMNPLVSDCGDERCSDAQERARLGLLFKSFQGYIETLAQSDEAVAVQTLLPIVARIKAAGLESVLAEDPAAAAEALRGILEQDDIVALVNPELLSLLQNSPDPAYHVADILAAVQGFGSFSADDPKILVRPGILNFQALADQLGTAGSFYAGYGDFPAARMEAWFEACAEPGMGKPWSEVRAMPAGESACGPEFYAMLGAYRVGFEASGAASRVDDKVGGFLPALISTSVLTGDAITAWEASKAQYDSGVDPTIDVNFDDVGFAYWGDPDSLSTLHSGDRTDLKSEKATSLGEASWRTALSLSPAEPGLARALPLNESQVSAGGWADLHPVLVLKDMGCDKVVYVTRTDGESNFAQGVARMLGMTDADASALYDLDNPESSFALSLAEADAVYCTNWNSFEGAQFEELANDAYNAPLQSTDDFFVEGSNAYANTTADTGLLGCSVPAGSASQ